MGNRKTRLLVIGLLLGVLIVIVYKTLYPEHRNIAAQSVDFILSANELTQEMSQSEMAKKYGDKVIHTYGRISAITGNIITLEDGVVVNLLDISGHVLEIGDSIAIKGRCIGYDDLLEEVKLDQASIIQE
ncbi:hypothetical protein [Allomuricauda sp. CP2A]|jgi:hypothetical protein|uniref:hypothetical protein n=1 Tax=Allomuricauda sp. CP2A TaxID=1848189 RepID=UPI000836481C|nr:hypothetical protein [Muricauda sp. CP2A]